MSGLANLAPRRVLVGYDMSDPSDQALDVAAQLVAKPADLHIVHGMRTVDVDYPGVVWPEHDDESRRNHAEQAIRARLVGTGMEEAQVHIVLGPPAQRILQLAEHLDVDLITVGSTGRTGLSRVLLWSVAERLVSHAPCPVRVVR